MIEYVELRQGRPVARWSIDPYEDVGRVAVHARGRGVTVPGLRRTDGTFRLAIGRYEVRYRGRPILTVEVDDDEVAIAHEGPAFRIRRAGAGFQTDVLHRLGRVVDGFVRSTIQASEREARVALDSLGEGDLDDRLNDLDDRSGGDDAEVVAPVPDESDVEDALDDHDPSPALVQSSGPTAWDRVVGDDPIV